MANAASASAELERRQSEPIAIFFVLMGEANKLCEQKMSTALPSEMRLGRTRCVVLRKRKIAPKNRRLRGLLLKIWTASLIFQEIFVLSYSLQSKRWRISLYKRQLDRRAQHRYVISKNSSYKAKDLAKRDGDYPSNYSFVRSLFSASKLFDSTQCGNSSAVHPVGACVLFEKIYQLSVTCTSNVRHSLLWFTQKYLPMEIEICSYIHNSVKFGIN